MQFRTKQRKSLKNILNCYVQIVFKSQRRLSSQFRFKEPLPYDLMSKVVYKYTCGRCNSSYYGETERHLRVGATEDIGLSRLTFKKCEPSKESAHYTKNQIFFFQASWKDGLSKKIALEYDLSCIIGKDDISFSRKYDLTC